MAAEFDERNFRGRYERYALLTQELGSYKVYSKLDG